MTFPAGQDRYPQRTLQETHNLMTNKGGCENVRYRPSRRPQYVIADVELITFLGKAYDAENVRLEIRF
jgi:hypothetical protein